MAEAPKVTYDVLLSYASEDREYVGRVAAELERLGVHCFYDQDEKAELLGTNLREELDDIFRNRGKFCVLFLSEHYAAKSWTQFELKIALARAFRETRRYVLPGRFDKTEVPGVTDAINYTDLNAIEAEAFAKLIAEIVQGLDQAPVPELAPLPPPKIRWWRRIAAFLKLGPGLVALGGAVVATVTFLLGWCGPSHTTVKYVSADANTIVLSVTNTGWKSSVLRSAVLEFSELGMVRDGALQPDNAVIRRRANDQIVRLKNTGLRAKTDPQRAKLYTRAQIEPKLMKTKATVVVTIEESGGWKKVDVPVDGADLRKLVQRQLPSDEEW